MNLYSRIKMRREELGMSQDELATRLGYKDRSTIAKIEAGVNDITQSKIKSFADALDTTTAWLMGWENSTEDNTKIPDDQSSEEPDKYFAQKLRDLRESRCLTIDEFCNQFNSVFNGRLNKSTVSRYENGIQEPLISTFKKIAQFYSIDPSDLLGYQNVDRTGSPLPNVKKEDLIAQGNGVFTNNHELMILISSIEKLPKHRWPEVKGMISHMLYEEGAADAAKQISDHLA